MFVHGAKTRTEEGQDIYIDCPACGTVDVTASTYDRIERVRFVGFPVTFRSTWVVCSSCHKHLLSRRPASELTSLSKDELGRTISRYTSFIARVMAVLALLLGWLPIIGPIVGLVAVVLNYRRGIWRTISWTGFSLGLISNALFGILSLVNT